MTSTNNIKNILPGSFALSVSCHEDLRALDNDSSVTSFTLSLDEDDQCDVSLFGDDEASFMGEDFDETPAGPCEHHNEEVPLVDHLEISERTEISTGNAPKSTGKSLATNIREQQEKDWKPRSTRRPVRRGGRRPAKVLVAE
ncbi:unnamed protein product [Cylindrotheca closterium]|uniref:Uncharacterized protein n=1 Tax=Cylindrotheca closterium TaxID=2856 RepID=A0AAD2FTV8_9STRA|nr:unnamed protein product [Cylindrotheca closterium]